MSGSQGPFAMGLAPQENGGQKRGAESAGFVDGDSDSEQSDVLEAKPAKKTKGRVKIKMEFIDNKLRRYTTFSKRKTGIMKKAYELSTLTGTQVMLLVASETGHVYTFATRKLQPMITSESGKALIQTCLNSPEIAGQTQDIDQRMNPTGFEEPDLSYAVAEEENKSPDQMKSVYLSQPTQSQAIDQLSNSLHAPQTLSLTTYMPSPVSTSSSTPMKQNNISMQFPTGGFVLPNTQQLATSVGLLPIQQQQQNQTVYRFPSSQVVTLSGSSTPNSSAAADATSGMSASVANNQTLSSNAAGTVMYQTPQGVVYAAPSTLSGLSEGLIFNFPQTPTALTLPEQQNTGQQFITIPVPVSLASSQVLQPMLAASADPNQDSLGQKK